MAGEGKGWARSPRGHNLSPEDRRERLAELVHKRGKLSSEDAALLHEVYPAIIELYHAAIWEQLRRRGLVQDLEDLVQETFVAGGLWVLENGFPDNLLALLRRMATNATLNHLRGQKRDPISVGLPSSGSTPAAPGPEPERAVDLRRVGALLLDTLSPEHREVFEAVSIHRLEYDEAAALLGLPLGTLKRRLADAKRAHVEILLPPSQRAVP